MVGDLSLGNGRGGDAGADAGREGTLLPGLKREREERGLSLQDLEERCAEEADKLLGPIVDVLVGGGRL